jgi:hypothetical protein
VAEILTRLIYFSKSPQSNLPNTCGDNTNKGSAFVTPNKVKCPICCADAKKVKEKDYNCLKKA